MEAVEPFLAPVVYSTTLDAQANQADNLVKIAHEKIRLLPGFRASEFGRAATLLAVSLKPQAYWLREHATVTAP